MTSEASVMENFTYPIKLEPLNRPVKRTAIAPKAQPAMVRPTEPRKRRAPLGLQEQRERNGVSLAAIAEHTRIPLRHLEELERGDVSQWPAGVYAKSWARDYAKEAGIDPERVIAIVAPVADVEPTIEEIKEVREERERARVDESPLAPLVGLMRRFAAVAVVIALIALAAIFYVTRSDSQPPARTTPAPVGTSGVTPGSPQR